MSLEGVLIVLTRSKDPAREDEWRAWYDGVHLPHVMETRPPGLTTARRYEDSSAKPDEPRSLAIYEFDDEPKKVFDGMVSRMDKRRAGGSTYTVDCLDVMHVKTYRRLHSYQAPGK